MKEEHLNYLRGGLVFLGILLMGYSIYGFYAVLSEFISSGNFELIEFSPFIFLAILFFTGNGLIFAGRHWNTFLRDSGKYFVLIAVFFLGLTIGLYTFSNHSSELVESVQPSLDFIILGSIDSFLPQEQAQITTNLRLELSDESIVSLRAIDNNSLALLWDDLGLNKEVSEQSKVKLGRLLLGMLSDQLKEQEELTSLIGDVPIPISLFSDQIPLEFKAISSYDVFNSNISIRYEQFNELRDFCFETDEEAYALICEGITLTSYDNLIKTVKEVLEQQGLDSNSTFTKILENVDELEKLEKEIEEKTSYWSLALLITLFSLAGAIGVVYYYYKKHEPNTSSLQTGLFLSKTTFFHMIFPSLFLIVLLIFLNNGTYLSLIGDVIKNVAGQDLSSVLETLPFFTIIENIFATVTYTYLMFFGLVICLYILFFLLLKRNKENTPLN